MKFMILNSSGNVGKSTLTREVFADRIDNLRIVEIETRNSSNSNFGIETEKLSGTASFELLYERIVDERPTVFDVGASEIGNFFDQLGEYEGAIQIFDAFVIPTRPNAKIMEDTVKTILTLRDLGVEDEKIKVVFNEVQRSVEEDFSPLLRFDFPFDTEIYVRQSNLITDLALLKSTFLKVYLPDGNYRAQMLAEKDPKNKKRYLKMDLINMGAKKKIAEFDFIFERLTGQKAPPLAFESKNKPSKTDKKAATPPPTVTEDGTNENDEEL